MPRPGTGPGERRGWLGRSGVASLQLRNLYPDLQVFYGARSGCLPARRDAGLSVRRLAVEVSRALREEVVELIPAAIVSDPEVPRGWRGWGAPPHRPRVRRGRRRLTSASSSPPAGAGLQDSLGPPPRADLALATLCRGLEALSDDSRMSRCDSQQRKCRPVRLSPALFPVPQGMNTDSHGAGELRLAESDEASQCRDVVSGSYASPRKTRPEPCRDRSLELLVRDLRKVTHPYRSM